MFLLGDDRRLVISASDLRTASACEFATVAELDVLRGRRAPVADPQDPMLARVAALGEVHEQAELRRLSRKHPGRVVQLMRPEYTAQGLATAMDGTLEALRGEADVVFQATLFDGGFVGHADFLQRTPQGWLVSDTKLARSESVAALLQIAAYAALLDGCGVRVAPMARLVLGDGEARDIPLDDLLPVYRARRERLDALLSEHDASGATAVWGDERWLACGRCAVCESEAEHARDLLLVAGMRGSTRRRLLDAGVRTVEELAVQEGPVTDVRTATLERLRAQARLQLEQDRDGVVRHEIVDVEALRRLPPPTDGDVFFDFEGDPLWQERGSSVWGLEYLFGMVEVDTGAPVFRAFWAHDRAEERAALVDFVDHIAERRRHWPGLHVYHYAPYEPSALLRLAARHGVYEDEVDQLLRDGVFVDLYATVRGGVRVSQRSYSIKKLEPLYMDQREGEVQGGADSIVVYHQFTAARVEGRHDEAATLIAEIAHYNTDDCVSTYRLREWLLARLAELGGGAGAPAADEDVAEVVVTEKRRAALELEAAVRSLVDHLAPADRDAEQHAIALVGASVLFHAREEKPKWQEHFERLRLPVADWRAADGVFLVEDVEVVEDWHLPPRARKPRRRLRLRGEPMRSAPMGVGAKVSAVYAVPAPAGIEPELLHANAKSPSGVFVLESTDYLAANGQLHQTLVVEELQPGPDGHEVGPVALVPNDNVSTAPIDGALREIAEAVVADGRPVPGAGTDVLLRRPPRLRRGAELPRVGAGPDAYIDAIAAALTAMDDSYLAVQGPPGTGKTHVGAHVIARLVAQGWAVGVCAQSHAAVENMLTKVVQATDTPAAQVAKVPSTRAEPEWTALERPDDLARFAAGHRAAGRGYVIGGTAWDLTNDARVARGQLDLLVIDEAGQFSLAKTLAVSVSAARLLLLGDPQQLPQVTTGTHAEPVDTAALVWVAGGEPVLPPELGYFLATTWRMHPALTAPVSALAYSGRLESNEAVTAARTLDGVEPGLHVRLVDHQDNSTSSPEEADAVLDLVEDLLGRSWSELGPDGVPRGARPLDVGDIVVITPYNQQANTLRRRLSDACLGGIRVGTVDKFQGQEAAVAIVSMAASSSSEVSRGIGFLLDRHRLNVAVSRGQHSAFVVCSERLGDFPPRTGDELRALGAFLGLCESAVSTLSSPQRVLEPV